MLTYNQLGYKIGENATNSFGRFNRKTFDYDKNGFLIEEKHYIQRSTLIYTRTSTYDEDGYLIEESEYKADGKKYQKRKFTYDEDGNLIELNRFDLKGNLKNKTTIEYDKNDNWIKKIEYVGFKPKFIITRDITYF